MEETWLVLADTQVLSWNLRKLVLLLDYSLSNKTWNNNNWEYPWAQTCTALASQSHAWPSISRFYSDRMESNESVSDKRGVAARLMRVSCFMKMFTNKYLACVPLQSESAIPRIYLRFNQQFPKKRKWFPQCGHCTDQRSCYFISR